MRNPYDDKEEILKLYSEGVLPVQIAKRLGFTHHQSVYGLLKKEGVFKPTRSKKRKYSLNEQFFFTIDTEEKAYILGLVCSDGYVAEDRLVFSISKKDVDILHKVRQLMGSNAPIKETVRRNPYTQGKPYCEMVHIQLASRELCSNLRSLGIKKNKTYTLCPVVFSVVPESLRRHFLRGYFDGDGNVMWARQYPSGKKFNINVCGNKEFLEATFQKCFPSTNKLYFEKKSKQTYVWKISSKDKVRSFMEYLYKDATIYLDRKYTVYLNTLM